MASPLRPERFASWHFPVTHGLDQSQVDAAPGKLLLVNYNRASDDPITLAANDAGYPVTHIVTGVPGGNHLAMVPVGRMYKHSPAAGLSTFTDYYPDAANPGHASGTINGPVIFHHLGEGVLTSTPDITDEKSTYLTPLTHPAGSPFDLHTRTAPYRRSIAFGTFITNAIVPSIPIATSDVIWEYTPFTGDGDRGGWVVTVPTLTSQVSVTYTAVHNGVTATPWTRVTGNYSRPYTVEQMQAFSSAGIPDGAMYWLTDVGKLVIWHATATTGDYQPDDGGPGFFEVLVDSDAIQDPVDTRALDPATLTITTAPMPYRVLISTNPDGAPVGQWLTDNAHDKIATTVDNGATWTYYQPEANDFVEVVDANIAGGEAPYATYTTTNGWVGAQGEVAENLPVLELIEITVTGYVTSVTLAADLVLTDGAGNLYDSADWRIISDDSDGVETTPIVSGTVLDGAVFSPPRNNDRTIGIVFAGNKVRSGLSAVTLQLRPGIGVENTGTTGLTAVKARYYTGDVELFSASGGQPGVQTYTFDAPFKFLTHPQVASSQSGISTIASQTELLALPSASLNDGDARSLGRTTYVWHAAMTPGQADGLPTLEPTDKANPGVDAGYWVQQVPELGSSFGDFRTSRTIVHTFGDASSIERVRFIASDQNYSTRKSLLQELEFDHFTQGGNGWTQVNGGAVDGDGFVSIEKQYELATNRHYRVEIFTRFNPDDGTAIDWRVESQYSYNVDVVNNVRSHDRLTIVDFEIVRKGASDAPAKNALVYPVGDFTALAVNDAGTGIDGAVYKLPAVDALQITLPNKAAMNPAEGIWRVRISGDWAALSTQTTVLSFVDDTANGVEMGAGLPDDGNEWLDLVFNGAGDEWIATSGGDVTLTQVVPTYTLHTEVPANIRLYLIDGLGGSAEGLWRKETVGDAPNHIG